MSHNVANWGDESVLFIAQGLLYIQTRQSLLSASVLIEYLDLAMAGA